MSNEQRPTTYSESAIDLAQKSMANARKNIESGAPGSLTEAKYHLNDAIGCIKAAVYYLDRQDI